MSHTPSEGVIKYNRSHLIASAPLGPEEFGPLEACRKLLFQFKLVGIYPDGIGFGNVSCRQDYARFQTSPRPQFLITGSQTGHLPVLGGEHYSRVLDFDIEAMKVLSMGVIQASSESLTHGAIYEVSPAVGAIIHGHHRALWEKMIAHNYPCTPASAAYGTADMARDAAQLARNKSEGLLVMKGHQDGMIAFAPTLHRARELVVTLMRELSL